VLSRHEGLLADDLQNALMMRFGIAVSVVISSIMFAGFSPALACDPMSASKVPGSWQKLFSFSQVGGGGSGVIYVEVSQDQNKGAVRIERLKVAMNWGPQTYCVNSYELNSLREDFVAMYSRVEEILYHDTQINIVSVKGDGLDEKGGKVKFRLLKDVTSLRDSKRYNDTIEFGVEFIGGRVIAKIGENRFNHLSFKARFDELLGKVQAVGIGEVIFCPKAGPACGKNPDAGFSISII
jgi:hypothetical protein